MSVVRGIREDNLIEDLAPIAVEIYNRKKNVQLKFWKVLRVDDPMKITLKAANGRFMNTYEATVSVEPMELNPVDVDGPDVEPSDLINKLAEFAVDEYNRKKNAHLEFWKVILEVKKQNVDDGIMYYITLKAVDGGLVTIYDAKVLVKLVDFQPVGGATSA
ncbi:putative Cystatin domain-containing protein [Helianthus annuus]|nr:putative Cystatin domain-containing protein [Helianthus annuus]KAJ0937872.1 putative Cystatin domain-containing protein [Helianthus annuus]